MCVVCVCASRVCVYLSGTCVCGWQVCVVNVSGMCALSHTHTHTTTARSHTHTYAYDNDGDGRAKKPMKTILFTTCPLLNTLLPISTYTLLQDNDASIETKPMSTILFGSTVEFEMAILTMAFLAGGDVCPFSLHTHTCIQRNTCMHARGREREFIGDYSETTCVSSSSHVLETT